MKVTDVPVDDLVRCDSCGKRIKARQHELTLIDPEGDQTLGRYHLSGPGECWKAAERFTTSEYNLQNRA